ncbi:Hypp1725 [Branchiostoma lanceolatum]|uniref:Hypp1725 protein n=1 Tax=Branchiostoma lanceolatum TaxID=7740 RepID=A0A8K0EPG0_BRALA|nr:Hypp1725 [Branchiostoma lanceolatum]
MADNFGADTDQSLVHQYGVEECTQIVQQIPTNGLPLQPYITPTPVVYKVYNINNPVGLQIESQGGLMAVEDPRKVFENRERESKETQTETQKNSRITLLKPMPKQSTCNRVDGVSQRIVARMELLEEQGNWLKYDKFLRSAMKRFEEDSDILVRIVLEDVVAAYFREDFRGGYTRLQHADDLVQKVCDPAQQQTHRLYLRSALLRKQNRHDEAENINTLALQGLPYMRSGRDTASVWYNIAALKAQVLYKCENSPDRANELYREAVSAFQNAIEHYGTGLDAKDETCRNHLRRSHIRLAMVAVGCWYDGTTNGTNPDLIAREDLQKAENSLSEVENSLWEGIPNRMRCSWYLAKSDLFRRRGKIQRAVEMAQEALRVAKKGDFPTEVKFAEVRLDLLRRTAELKIEEAQEDEDVGDMAWLSSEESTEETDMTLSPKTKNPYPLRMRQPRDKSGSEAGEDEISSSRTTTWAQSAVLLMISILLPVLTALLIHCMYVLQ